MRLRMRLPPPFIVTCQPSATAALPLIEFRQYVEPAPTRTHSSVPMQQQQAHNIMTYTGLHVVTLSVPVPPNTAPTTGYTSNTADKDNIQTHSRLQHQQPDTGRVAFSIGKRTKRTHPRRNPLPKSAVIQLIDRHPHTHSQICTARAAPILNNVMTHPPGPKHTHTTLAIIAATHLEHCWQNRCSIPPATAFGAFECISHTLCRLW